MKERERVRVIIEGIQCLAQSAGRGLVNMDLETVDIALSRIYAESTKALEVLVPNAPTLTPTRTLHQYTLDGEFVATHKNCADASRAIGGRATRQDISLAARGKAHAAGGYRWLW